MTNPAIIDDVRFGSSLKLTSASALWNFVSCDKTKLTHIARTGTDVRFVSSGRRQRVREMGDTPVLGSNANFVPVKGMSGRLLLDALWT